jgi:hypothetical protein
LATTSYIGGAQTSKHFLPFLLYIAILCSPASSVLQEALVTRQKVATKRPASCAP